MKTNSLNASLSGRSLVGEVDSSTPSRGSRKLKIGFCLLALWLGCAPAVRAQWLTQSFTLTGGWNAIYTHVDSSYTNLNALVGADANNPIQEIWMWSVSPSAQQFVNSPQQPTTSASQWVVWTRTNGTSSALQTLSGNVACLVRVSSGTTSYTWNLKGAPAPPKYQWTSSGLNFIGFPTPSASAPTYEAFLAAAPTLAQSAEIYQYPGGDLGANNPARIFNFRGTPVVRGQAVWIRTGTAFNNYFGPLNVQLQSASGILFRDNIGQYQIRLQNMTSSQITITANLLASETPPAGQTAIVQAPPVLVRGAQSLVDLTYGFTNLNAGPQTWVLAPNGQAGSDIPVILGINRSAMSGSPGSLYAGTLRFTDGAGLSQLDIPVSATVGSSAGLWVGGVSVTGVAQYLKNYAQATNEVAFTNLLASMNLTNGAGGVSYVWDSNTGRVLVFGGTNNQSGSYLLNGPITTSSGAVAQPYPLRLILHNDGTTTRLFQHIFYGIGLSSNPVVAVRESLLLSSQLASARRITAVHLPNSVSNTFWGMTGSLQQGSSLSTTVSVSYADSLANPFIHEYHPDHDNLDAQFATVQPQGVESYGITRQITLNFTAPANDFDSLTAGGQTLSGNYVESITLLGKGTDSKQFQSLGFFSLKQLSNIATLTQ